MKSGVGEYMEPIGKSLTLSEISELSWKADISQMLP